MKNLTFSSLIVLLLVSYACSNDDGPASVEPPPEGLSAIIDGKLFAPTETWLDTVPPDTLVKLPETIRIIATDGQNTGIMIGVSLQNGKLEPGIYSLKPDADGDHNALIF